MTDEIYRQAFEQAKADLAGATTRKEKAEAEVSAAQAEALQFRRTVTALAILLGENVEDSMGLTAAVRVVYRNRPTAWIPVRSLKVEIEELGVSLADLKNPDASVLSVLNRLVTAGELEAGVKKFKFGNEITEAKAWKLIPKPAPSTDQVPEVSEDDIPF